LRTVTDNVGEMSHTSKIVDYSDGDDEEEGQEKDGESLLQGGAYLSWHHLNYTVFNRSGLKKKPLQLLHDVSGYVKPGSMLALMVRTPAFHASLRSDISLTRRRAMHRALRALASRR
jgi:hypothetical protein